jgi:hypothetical protein
MIKKLLIGAAIAGLIALVIQEFPAIRREIKIWRM